MTLAPYPNEVFSAFAFLAFVLSFVCIPWQLKHWNVGALCFMFWAGIGSLNVFINSIIWKGNAINSAPIWCDISTHITIALNVAIPACSLAINHRLFQISREQVVYTQTDKRRAVIVDLAMGLGLPILQMAVHIIPQGHRFDIYEDVGCVPTVYNTPMAFVFVYIWPVIIALASFVLCGLTAYRFGKKITSIDKVLRPNASLTSSRYLRLMCLSLTDICFSLPLASWALYLNATVTPIFPWRGWADTHSNFGRVIEIPSAFWHLNNTVILSRELTRWAPVFSGLLFFALFGFAEEARMHYRLGYRTVLSSVGLGSKASLTKSNGALDSRDEKSTLPVFVSTTTHTDTGATRASLQLFGPGRCSKDFFAALGKDEPSPVGTDATAFSPTVTFEPAGTFDAAASDSSRRASLPPSPSDEDYLPQLPPGALTPRPSLVPGDEFDLDLDVSSVRRNSVERMA